MGRSRGRKEQRVCVRGSSSLTIQATISIVKRPVNLEARVVVGQAKAGAALLPQAWQQGTGVLPTTH